MPDRIIAPQRASTVLRGRRYQLKAPIDFSVQSWVQFMGAYDEFAGAVEPAEINERLMVLMGRIFWFGEERPAWGNLLRRALRRPVVERSGPDVRTVLSWTFGERLQALQDFTTALSVSGATMTRPRTIPTQSPPRP